MAADKARYKVHHWHRNKLDIMSVPDLQLVQPWPRILAQQFPDELLLAPPALVLSIDAC